MTGRAPTRTEARHFVLSALYRALSEYHAAQTQPEPTAVTFCGLPDQTRPESALALFRQETRAALRAHAHLGVTFTPVSGTSAYLLTPARPDHAPGRGTGAGLSAAPGYPLLTPGAAVRVTAHLLTDGENHVGRTGVIAHVVDDEAPLYVTLDGAGPAGPVPFKCGEVQAISHRARLAALNRSS
ncbi:hypothetical protein [Deinococcus soli (ex Cha et al. 2016)]|uniref:Uncharacterized protein n=2 Tax=Deinococcus soli (ex Cha et al. 2016) TaxID=1309411 RepID=A0ACC6KGM0_9DEIO|nr:hypothetical protein [Deinococcus soli (ex Cha et al. 2016)]MDR6218170.1 hypothetical protein [Deinococcus soli (ex Cha et al. 2016)]MDR6328910.1 hypothetical protein [Deinococcus soli (ex Cha et al. 2016)]MDR6751602.1 hypothetical protein [Deinococcus soli (ex Cha et al. 2016)]